MAWLFVVNCDWDGGLMAYVDQMSIKDLSFRFHLYQELHFPREQLFGRIQFPEMHNLNFCVLQTDYRGLFSWHDVLQIYPTYHIVLWEVCLMSQVGIWCLDCCAVLLKLEQIFMLRSTGVELDNNWLNYQTKRSLMLLSSGVSYMNHFRHYPPLRAM